MGLSKEQLLQSGSVSNQQAIVKRLQNNRIKPKKRPIPGGKNMLDVLDKQNLEDAAYNWLRGCAAFTEVTLCFAKDPSKFSRTSKKVVAFDGNGQFPIWESHKLGRKYLAQQITSVLKEYPCIQIIVKKNGIWIETDDDNNFAPKYEVTQADIDEQVALFAEIQTERLQEDPEATNIDFSAQMFELGQKIPSPDWEPYIEFMPVRIREYK
jgi:hypothetical protein